MLYIPSAFPVTLIAQEPQLRAAVILGVVRFTSWPEGAPGDTLTFCMVGKPISEPVLKRVAATRTLLNKPISVRLYKSDVARLQSPAIQACNIAVVGSGSLQESLAKVLQKIPDKPILIICDGCTQLQDYSSIVLKQEEGKIRFSADLVNAGKRKLTFSSSLLELASEVKQ